MTITNGYITLKGLKNYLKIDDSVEDTLLEQVIEAASRTIDRMANRRFYLDTNASARTYRPNNELTLAVDDIGSTSGLIVKTDPDSTGTYQTTLTLNDDYILDPPNSASKGRPWTFITIVGAQGFSLPTTARPQVEVTARWGWPSIPDDVEQACYILASDLYKRKDSIGGVLGLSELGAIRMSPLGRDVAIMVRAYRKEFFG